MNDDLDKTESGDGVSFVARVALTLGRESIPFGHAAQSAIDAHWASRASRNPALFDGAIVMLGAYDISHDTLRARCLNARFRDYLFWREVCDRGRKFCADDAEGAALRNVRHLFGCGLLITRDGGFVTVRAAAGTMNDGRLHLPGGFVDRTDAADRHGTASVDIDRQIARELDEELGLSHAMLEPQSGYIVCHSDREVGVVRPFELGMSSDEAQRHFNHAIAKPGRGENTEVFVVAPGSETAALDCVPYCQLVLEAAANRV